VEEGLHDGWDDKEERDVVSEGKLGRMRDTGDTYGYLGQKRREQRMVGRRQRHPHLIDNASVRQDRRLVPIKKRDNGEDTVEEGKTAVAHLSLHIEPFFQGRNLANIGNDIPMRNQHTLGQTTGSGRKVQKRNFIPSLSRPQSKRDDLRSRLADPYQLRNRDKPGRAPFFNEEDPRLWDSDHPSRLGRGFQEGRVGENELGFREVELVDEFVRCVDGICAGGNGAQT